MPQGGGSDGTRGGALDDALTSASALATYLTENFLGAENKIKWGALGTTVIGSLIYKFWATLTNSAIGVMEGNSQLVTEFRLSTQTSIQSLATTITTELDAAWQSWQMGILTLPLNTITILVAFLAVAYLVKYVRSLRGDF